MSRIQKCLLIGVVIRFSFIIYGEWHDKTYEVPFTDVDYKVFTDAARHIVNGESPYNRHTYRYPPLIALLLTPNIILHPVWGKVLFSVADVATAYVIYMLVKLQGQPIDLCIKCSLVWILNPLAVVISTRGNSDSIIALIVLMTVYLLQKRLPALAGLLLGLAIHIRLYPLVFTLAMYLSLKTPNSTTIITHKSSGFPFIKQLFKKLFWCLYPNKDQIYLTVSCIANLLIFTGVSYLWCGNEYLDESILYHLRRKDTRHNFSVYFYLQYLNPNQSSFLIFLPQSILLLVFSFIYGTQTHISFCLLLQTIIIVAYNPVLTSQYFIWFLSLLPPTLPYIKLTARQVAALASLWIAAQLAWLLPAYWLEFRGRNTFLYIWLQGIAFFCANLAVLVRFIKAYKVKLNKIE